MVWQVERRIGEGITGYFAEAKIAGFSQTSRHSNSATRPVFDRFGNKIHEATVRGNPRSVYKWAYYRPTFERSTTPWSRSSRVIGMLTVRSSADNAEGLFKTEEFRNMVDSIATEVSPYLDAIQVLTGEEKL